MIETKPEHLNAVLTQMPNKPEVVQLAILSGIEKALKGWIQAPKPKVWDTLVATTTFSVGVTQKLKELNVLFNGGAELKSIITLVLDINADVKTRSSGLATLIKNKIPELREVCTKLLNDRSLQFQAIQGLSSFDDDEIAKIILTRYQRFSVEEKSQLIEVLVSRPNWAKLLLEAMKAGKIVRTELSAYQARQILVYKDPDLNKALAVAWGELRESSASKQAWVSSIKDKLTREALASADLSSGRQLFYVSCGPCHTIYGIGGKIGPDLTGSGRADLDYLLDNISDPSAVVSADYLISMLKLKDGRYLSGVIVSENDKTLLLKTANEELSILKNDIESRESSKTSMMPEGLLQSFNDQQIRDLIAYLQHPQQVPEK